MQKFVGKYNKQNSDQIKTICQEFSVGKVVAELILARGLEPDEIFLEREFFDPFLLSDMKPAVESIKSHVELGNKITIFGDYDVDGVCSTAILYLYLKSIGANVDYLLPNRHETGYGLNISLLQQCIENGSKLVITVDCGISSLDEAEFCKENGLDLIITDHHQVQGKLPNCVAVVNPLLAEYPFASLCGAGVAGKLVHALGGLDEFYKYIDLMAVATIADIVPLISENRKIVKDGLSRINSETRASLLALKAVSGIQNNIEVGNIAFGIAPRLNAAGRMSKADSALELIIEQDFEVAQGLAKKVDEENKARQKQEELIIEEAIFMVENQIDLLADRIIILSSPNWNKGIIGIVASKLVEKYHRPVILFTEEDGILTGSGRSIHGIHLFQLIHQGGKLLTRYGGHEMAAGMSIEKHKLELFRDKLNEHLAQNMADEIFVSREYYDLQIPLAEINMKLIEDLEKLQPMGMGNKTPAFLIRNIEIGGIRFIGERKNHVKFTLISADTTVSGVGFNMADQFNQIDEFNRFDVIVNVERNSWQGRDNAQVILKAFKTNIKDNISGVVNVGAKYFKDSLMSIPTDSAQLDHRRMRKMWRGDVYLGRRVAKDVLGTAIYSSVPACSRHILNLLNNQGLIDNLEVCYGQPTDSTCLVISPDWNHFSIPHERLIIYDYAPSEFIKKVMDYNPNIKIVLCNNDEIEHGIFDFIYKFKLDRQYLLGYYSTVKQYLPIKKKDMVAKNQYRLAVIIDIFLELGLIKLEDGVFSLLIDDEKRKLEDSLIYNRVLEYGDIVSKELKILLDACNKKRLG